MQRPCVYICCVPVQVGYLWVQTVHISVLFKCANAPTDMCMYIVCWYVRVYPHVRVCVCGLDIIWSFITAWAAEAKEHPSSLLSQPRLTLKVFVWLNVPLSRILKQRTHSTGCVFMCVCVWLCSWCECFSFLLFTSINALVSECLTTVAISECQRLHYIRFT